MTRSRLLALIFLAAFAPLAALAQPGSVQDGIAGAWLLVSVVSQGDDGTRGEPFGKAPKGIMVFTRDGRFSLFQSAAEAMAVGRDSIACCGTYATDEAARELPVGIEGSTHANLLGGGAQRRIITGLTPDELAFSNPRTPNGLTLHTAWRRPPPP